MNLHGKVVVLTGAGSGMGRELALQLLDKGALVAGVDLRSESLAETKRLALSRNQGSFVGFALDITDHEAVLQLPTKVESALGPADLLINNAGIIQPFLKVSALNEKDIERVMAVNFSAPLNLIKVFLPILMARSEAHILNVASMGAYAPVPGQSVYGASKAAIGLLSEGLRLELLDTRVGVTVIYPGAVSTNIAANSGLAQVEGEAGKKFKTTSPLVAAQTMIQAIEKNKPRAFIGSDAKLMNRLSRISPSIAGNLIYKQMKSLLK
jgi:short-subunit dehydrogenase